MRYIDEIILHCTDTPYETTVESIRKYHISQGWKDIGYHYLIDYKGVLHNGRRVSFPGAHCKGHNAHSIGIAYIGKEATDEQVYAMMRLCAELIGQFKTITKITRHCDYNKYKTCPNLTEQQYEKIKSTLG